MVDLSRRSFLIGSAAAIAVAAIPRATALPIEPAFYKRRYFDIGWVPNDYSSETNVVRLVRGDKVIWKFRIGAGSSFRWVVRPHAEICVRPEDAPLQFDVSGRFGILDLWFKHYANEGADPEIYSEQREFLRSGETVTRVVQLQPGGFF